MNRFVISDKPSLAKAFRLTDLDEIVIETEKLKYRGLMPWALKYAFWAVRPGGKIVVQDDGRRDPANKIFEVSFNAIRQWTFKFIGRDTECTNFDSKGRLELVRRAPVLPPGWSAGVIFSGNATELEQLKQCLEGLLAQPELSADRGGEIVVCGPGAAASAIAGFPGVKYLSYDPPPSARFLICEKKNFLMGALRGPRMAVLHARIVLEPGSLASAPREFDILAPNTQMEEQGKRAPYLSLLQSDAVVLGRFGSIQKIIVMFRAPATRIVSNYQSIAKTSLHTHDRAAFLKHHRIEFDQMLVTRYLQPYLDRFGRDKLLFLFTEDLRDGGVVAQDKIAAFLGIDANGFAQGDLGKRINAAKAPRMKGIYNLAKNIRDRYFKNFEFVTTIENKLPFLKKILFSEPEPPPDWLMEELRARKDLINADTRKLEEITGRDLGSWIIA